MFGLASYVIYVLIYAYGLYLFFREKRMKIRLNNYFFGGLLIFISILIISTLIVLNTGEQAITLGIKDGTAADGTVIYGTGFSASGVSKSFVFSGTVSGEIETKDNKADQEESEQENAQE